MSSRGAIVKCGFVTTDDYKIIKVTKTGVKILAGLKNNHSLPELSHSPNAIYAKLKDDGVTLHEMRFFDEKGMPIIEIAYHPEPNLNNNDRETNIVHFHLFKGLKRDKPVRIKDNSIIKEKYKKYLKEFELYDKC